MKLQEELSYLKGFIKLSERDAIKRDCLEQFLSTRNKIALLDADSLLFNVCNFHLGKETENDFELMYDDYHTQLRTILNAIEEDGFIVDSTIHFFSTCSKNFRYEIYPEYKANRERTPLTSMVYHFKHYVISVLESEGEQVRYSDTLEADDLIAEAVELLEDNYPIVLSIDKDLKQIPCCHFDYYKIKVGVDEFGEPVRAFRGFEYCTPLESKEKLLRMLLIGDNSDGIKGANRVGIKTAEKLLNGKGYICQLKEVISAYGDTERLRKNIKLIQLNNQIQVK